MTAYLDADKERLRQKRRERIAVRKRRRLIVNRVMTPFVFLAILALCAGFIANELGQPEQDARLVEFVEAQGGEVTKIDHPGASGRWGGRSGPGYVDVVFSGKQSRCAYHLLAVNPRSLDCDPAVTPSQSESRR